MARLKHTWRTLKPPLNIYGYYPGIRKVALDRWLYTKLVTERIENKSPIEVVYYDGENRWAKYYGVSGEYVRVRRPYRAIVARISPPYIRMWHGYGSGHNAEEKRALHKLAAQRGLRIRYS